jgi:hypothetical protein
LRQHAFIPLDASPARRHISSVNSTPPEPPRMLARRKLHWWMFWLVFLSTPVAVISLPILFKHFPQIDVMNDYGLFEASSSLLAGSFAAAFIFARLRSTTTTQLIVRTLGFGLLFTVLLGAISFAGCMTGYRS